MKRNIYTFFDNINNRRKSILYKKKSPKVVWRVYSYVKDNGTIRVYVGGWRGDYPTRAEDEPIFVVQTKDDYCDALRKCQEWCNKTNAKLDAMENIVREGCSNR